LGSTEIENWTVNIDKDIHGAISSAAPGRQPWWDQQLLSGIAQREAALGRKLTKPEVLEEANRLLKRVEGFSP
jgi:hypothetical protein